MSLLFPTQIKKLVFKGFIKPFGAMICYLIVLSRLLLSREKEEIYEVPEKSGTYPSL